ncbi:MAG: ATPase [Planctomycetes bacterium]|nr:ATPase [Planctomycetota bacterium]
MEHRPNKRVERKSSRTNTRNVQPHAHDSYRHDRKTKHAIVCDECGVVFHGGRWYWGAPPLGDEEGGLCPACARIRDGYPAGSIELKDVPDTLRDEVLRMIRNVEDQEKDEHPLERLMEVEERDGMLVATTTGTHLPRCIAGALRRRFHDGVAIRYPDGEGLVRVMWEA